MDSNLIDASFYIECGRLHEAKKLLADRAARSGWDSTARLLMAQVAIKQGDFIEAENQLCAINSSSGVQDGITIPPKLVAQQAQALQGLQPIVQAAEEAMSSKSWQVARQQAQQCLDSIHLNHMPGLAVKLLLLQATASEKLHDYKVAVEALDLALQLEPTCKAALWRRAAAQTAACNHQAAFLDLRRLSTLQADYPGLLEALQLAAHACSEQRRAAVHATAPPRRYSRITREGCSQSAHRSTGPSGVHSLIGNTSLRAQVEYYEVLGLGPTAGSDDIRQAYKRLAAKLHPDKQHAASEQERQAAEEQFKAVTAAYQALVG